MKVAKNNIADIDPIKETIKRIENEKENEREKNIALSPTRGTTVPTIAGRMSKGNSSAVIFEDVASIIPADPFTFGYVKIGVILGSHGVKGEVKIQLETDFGDYRIQPGNILYIKRPNRRSPRPITILNGRLTTNNIYIVSFHGIEDRIAANVLRNYNIYGRNEDMPGLSEDEYMIRDLVDLECYHQRDLHKPGAGPIGIVAGVVTPDELCDAPSISKLMHSMLEIRKCSDSGDSEELCLVPLVKEIVTHIDLKAKRIYLDPPEGLLELGYKEVKKFTLRGFLPASVIMDPQKRKLLEQAQIVLHKL
jgi:16S rRNA processing protein RimM